jgi:50S ribosomal protein L16 3-hydroxylase
MDLNWPLPLLGGLSPQAFMKRHWQKKPLLVRQAIANFAPPVDRAALFAMAELDDVQSRLVIGQGSGQPGWRLRQGPFARRSLPALKQPGWTLLVQGVDLQHEAVHALINRFRFIPDARLDDVMISYASDGGGVGPHFDSYDVFLLQAKGHRRWRIGRQKDLSLQPDMPLKLLAQFEPEQEYLLEPGDMLYLPPRYAHDGIAVGECMTYSIGFRSPGRGELARELLQRLADVAQESVASANYRDPGQAAVDEPARLPAALVEFARDSLAAALRSPQSLGRALGEYLTEPKPLVWFDANAHPLPASCGVRLDRRTRMIFDEAHVFINGESFLASGRDARLMQRLGNERQLDARSTAGLSVQARELLMDWHSAGWLHGD